MAPRSTPEPRDPERFTREWNRFYTGFARTYDLAVRLLPVWKSWLRRAVPHLCGPRVLEVSFGTGYLLTQYAGRFETHGVDYNRSMTRVARRNLDRAGTHARLVRADVARLPYPDACFDSVLNTMAFSGYPDGEKAIAEMLRVLVPGGNLVLIDFVFPEDGNWLGTQLTRLIERSGDVIRDLGGLFRKHGLEYSDEAIGGWRSVHLFLATKPRFDRPAPARRPIPPRSPGP